VDLGGLGSVTLHNAGQFKAGNRIHDGRMKDAPGKTEPYDSCTNCIRQVSIPRSKEMETLEHLYGDCDPTAYAGLSSFSQCYLSEFPVPGR
jgi:hypothetical protein